MHSDKIIDIFYFMSVSVTTVDHMKAEILILYSKQLILRPCFLAQHPQAWTSHPRLTPGEKEAEEL